MLKGLHYNILRFLIFIIFLVILLLLFQNNEYTIKENLFYLKKIKSFIEVFSDNKSEYKQNCLKLFKKKRSIDSSLLFKPPLKKPPADLLEEFQQNGDMPIKKYSYYNDVYQDSDSLINGSNEKINEQTFNDLLNKINKNESFNYYHDTNLKDLFLSDNYYKKSLKNKTIVVFGTILMWIETLAYIAGSSKIFTLDFTRKTYFNADKFQWFHMLDYLDHAIKNELIENFDNAASYSSFGKIKKI